MHQGENCAQSVARLPLYLKSTKKLICLFDHVWTTRLWCVFELAVYLRLREKPNVEFKPVAQKSLEFISVTYYITWYSIHWILLTLEASGTSCTTDLCQKSFRWLAFIMDTLMAIVIFFFGQWHFISRMKLRDAIQHYDVREAKLGFEADRELILSFIDDLFKPKVLDVFASQATRDRTRSHYEGSARFLSSTMGDDMQGFGTLRNVRSLRSSEHSEFDRAERIDDAEFEIQSDVNEGEVSPTQVQVASPVQFASRKTSPAQFPSLASDLSQATPKASAGLEQGQVARPESPTKTSQTPSKENAAEVAREKSVDEEGNAAEVSREESAGESFTSKGPWCDDESSLSGEEDRCERNVEAGEGQNEHLDDDIIDGRPTGDSRSTWRPDCRAVTSPSKIGGGGIDVFNKAVRTWVPRTLPVRGLRSYKLFDYKAAVLCGSVYVLGTLDALAYNGGKDDVTTQVYMHGTLYPGGMQSIRTVVCIMFQVLVLIPFAMYLLGLEVRLFLWVQNYFQKLTGLSYRVVAIPFIFIFIFVENILSVRMQIMNNISMFTDLVIVYAYLPCRFSYLGTVCTRLSAILMWSSDHPSISFDLWSGVRKLINTRSWYERWQAIADGA